VRRPMESPWRLLPCLPLAPPLVLRRRTVIGLPTTLLTQIWWPWRPPPLSKIMSKHDEDMGYIGKYQRTAVVSARWFDTTNDKKARIFT
jgi:hypothetical protein